MKQLIFFLTFLFCTTTLVLAESNINDSVRLDEVVVTGSKIETTRKIVPITVAQINRKDIENSGQLNILTTLNTYIPGIFVTERNVLGFGVSTGGSGSISIRGVGSSPNTGVLVLIDGHPQYQGIFGHPLADAYVSTDVEKVEVISGPGSILYGSNAMGGVINILTRKNEKEGLNGSLGSSYGSFNTQKYYATLGYKKNKLSTFVSANHDQTDGIRDKTDFKIDNGFLKIGYDLNEHYKLTADVSMAKFNANDNGSIYKPMPFNIDITRGKTSLSVDNQYNKLEGSFKMYHNFGTHDLSDGFHSTDKNSGLMFYQTLKLFSTNKLTLGTDLKQYGGMANRGKAANVLKTVNELAVYAYTQQQLVQKVTLSAGLRMENHSVYGQEFIPMAGINYNPSNTTTVKALVSKGFRNPTIMELYLYAPNEDLQPEQMVNYEISWLQSLLDNRLNLGLTVYKAKGENTIQVVGQGPTAQRQNVGSFTNQGFEATARYSILPNLMLHANYSYLDLKTPILAAPRQQLNVSANYRYAIWSLNAHVQHIEKLYTAVSPIKTETYTLLNVRLSAQPVKNLELFLAGNNLLDKQYEINYGYPLAGIHGNVGVNYKF